MTYFVTKRLFHDRYCKAQFKLVFYLPHKLFRITLKWYFNVSSGIRWCCTAGKTIPDADLHLNKSWHHWRLWWREILHILILINWMNPIPITILYHPSVVQLKWKTNRRRLHSQTWMNSKVEAQVKDVTHIPWREDKTKLWVTPYYTFDSRK